MALQLRSKIKEPAEKFRLVVYRSPTFKERRANRWDVPRVLVPCESYGAAIKAMKEYPQKGVVKFDIERVKNIANDWRHVHWYLYARKYLGKPTLFIVKPNKNS